MTPDVIERFWAKVDRADLDGCWVWTASTARGEVAPEVAQARFDEMLRRIRTNWQLDPDVSTSPAKRWRKSA